MQPRLERFLRLAPPGDADGVRWGQAITRSAEAIAGLRQRLAALDAPRLPPTALPALRGDLARLRELAGAEDVEAERLTQQHGHVVARVTLRGARQHQRLGSVFAGAWRLSCGEPAATRIGERVVGTKGVAIPNNATITGEKPFNYTGPNKDPMVMEHTDLIASIRANNPLNETLQVAESTLTAIGARMAAYTGREVSWKWLMEGSKLDLFPANPGPGPGIFGPVAIPGTTPLV
jgi:hypothetical protein